jgi:hypothetical protein
MKLLKWLPFLLCIIIFIFISFRAIDVAIPGNDTYYFLNYVFGNHTDNTEIGFLARPFFDIIPANIMVIRIIMLLFALATIYLFMKCAEQYNPKTSWLAGVLFLCGAFVTKFLFEFEDDLFALPFVMLAMYFIIKYQSTKKTKYIWYSLPFLGIAIGIWKFAIFYFILFLFMTNFHKIYLFLSIGLIPFAKNLIGYIFAGFSFQVAEYTPGLYLLGISIFLLFATKKECRIKENWLTIIFFSILSALNSKLAIVLFPLLIFNITTFIKNYSKYQKYLLFLFSGLYFVGLCFAFVNAYPNQDIKDLISIAQLEQINNYPTKEIKPYWGFGHFYTYHTKKQVKNYKSYIPTEKDGIIITHNLDNLHCELLYKNKTGQVLFCP